MQFTIRALLVATAFVGCVFAAYTVVPRFLRVFDYYLKDDAYVALVVAVYSPFWIPAVVAAYSAGRRKFDWKALAMLIAAELAAFGLAAIAIYLYDQFADFAPPGLLTPEPLPQI